MNANGIKVIKRLKNPSRLQPQATPSSLNIGAAASGKTAPKILRQQLAAAMALAAYWW